MPKRALRAEQGADAAEVAQNSGEAKEFLSSLTAMHNCVTKHNIEAMLDASGGFIKIRNFMPSAVAEHALATLQSFEGGEWVADKGDCHQFASISCDNAAGYENLTVRPRLRLTCGTRIPLASRCASAGDRAAALADASWPRSYLLGWSLRPWAPHRAAHRCGYGASGSGRWRGGPLQP
jgi:hypothetical protein